MCVNDALCISMCVNDALCISMCECAAPYFDNVHTSMFLINRHIRWPWHKAKMMGAWHLGTAY
jgi:hypothetical protein